ncbi:MAG: OmpA family protein [Bacteroidota bacterium]
MKLTLISLFLATTFSLSAQTFDTLQFLSSTVVYFDFAKADIRADADSTLQLFVENLPENIDSVYITAHTDSIGNLQSNLRLSRKRAKAVIDILVLMGIDSSLFDIDVFGERDPIAANYSEEGRQQNRRATIEAFRTITIGYMSGKIVDPETGEGIENANVIVRSKISRDSVFTDSTGTFKAKAPMGGVVGIDVFAEDYFFETLMKRLSGKQEEVKVNLQSLKAGASVDLKNFYFKGNSPELLKRSEPELPKLLRFMNYNEDLKIEIAGHVNVPNSPPVPTRSFSYKLSVARAQAVYNYLIKNGISEERMEFKGYGNWKMRFPTARSLEDQEANRRVEIKVLSVE